MKYFFTFLFSGIISISYSQSISGFVFEKAANGKQQPLVGVNVFWAGGTTGTTTNAEGKFNLELPEQLPASLIFSYVGYSRDTVLVTGPAAISVELKSAVNLSAVTIEAREQTTKISTLAPVNVETLTTKELQKAACCNLSESFETNASVDVSYSDAVSGAKQIKMLGLEGSYTQILTENIPSVRGLAAPYGLGFIPGPWLQSIDITKGAGSVVNGYESMAGQINVELLKPERADKFFLNGYAGDLGRAELNTHFANKFTDRWSGMLFGHASGIFLKTDNNKDGFLDSPLSRQYNVFNRWKYEDPGKLMAQFGVKALVDERQGGQVNFNPGELSNRLYGIGINNKQFDIFSKTAWGFLGHPYKSIGLISNARYHELDSYFGRKKYSGEQRTLYFNLIYQSIIGTSDHKIKTGASYLSDNYRESFNDSAFSRIESVPGAFIEYNYDIPQKLSLLGGLRSDYHNLYGLLLNPRAHIKINLLPLTVLRISGGRGLRVANIFAENSSVMASSRQVLVQDKLLPEITWNYGGGIIHKFEIWKREAIFTGDFYRTEFQNQVIADMENPRLVRFYNLKGVSYSNTAQADFTFEPVKSFTIKTSYKWQDAKTTYSGKLLQRPFVSRHRALLNLAYVTKFDKWKFDLTAKWNNESRIPSTIQNPVEYRMAETSPAYYIFNAQVTRAFKHFEVYLGGENLTNFIQEQQIIAAGDPFGTYFDASLVWGPVMGRVIYAGFRYTIK